MGLRPSINRPEKLDKRSVKDGLGLHVPGLYTIPCMCKLCYIGQMGKMVVDGRKKHQKCTRLGYPDKSTLAEHNFNQGHDVLFDDTVIVTRSAFLVHCQGSSGNSVGTKCIKQIW